MKKLILCIVLAAFTFGTALPSVEAAIARPRAGVIKAKPKKKAKKHHKKKRHHRKRKQ